MQLVGLEPIIAWLETPIELDSIPGLDFVSNSIIDKAVGINQCFSFSKILTKRYERILDCHTNLIIVEERPHLPLSNVVSDVALVRKCICNILR